jgi:hypothetical protein
MVALICRFMLAEGHVGWRRRARILDWQQRAIELRVLGLRYREIADNLGRSERTLEGVFQRPDIQAETERLRGLVEQNFLRVAHESLAGALHGGTYGRNPGPH